MTKKIAVIILAAGKSTRMQSNIPKVLHPLCGRPMLEYVLDLAASLKAKKTVCVLGYKHREARKILRPQIKVAIQKRLVGTASAVKTGLASLVNFKGTVLVLYGDMPLLKKETVKALLDYHLKNRADATLLTARIKNPAGYGRILRDRYYAISGIVEDKDADAFQKEIREVNTGIVCFEKEKLSRVLKAVRPNNRKKEYYLTDVISLFYRKGYEIESLLLKDINEACGINSRKDLSFANRLMQTHIHEELMKRGVSIVDPITTFIASGVKIGKDSLIYPFTVIERNVKIGLRCQIGPFVHLREGTVIDKEVALGNFLETARTKIGAKAWIRHFGYLGDSVIGRGVNIGAGVVTANFDGKKKHSTLIQDGAFIGSDTILVAPVKIGKKASTGAGCVILKNRNVAAGSTVAGVPARKIC